MGTCCRNVNKYKWQSFPSGKWHRQHAGSIIKKLQRLFFFSVCLLFRGAHYIVKEQENSSSPGCCIQASTTHNMWNSFSCLFFFFLRMDHDLTTLTFPKVLANLLTILMKTYSVEEGTLEPSQREVFNEYLWEIFCCMTTETLFNKYRCAHCITGTRLKVVIHWRRKRMSDLSVEEDIK